MSPTPTRSTSAADLVRATMPPVRTVVNNAGAVLRKSTEAITDAEWRKVMAVNLDGTFYVTRAFIPDLEHNAGRVINIASIAGREGTALLAAYCAAKHGVVGLTRALAEELRAAKVSRECDLPRQRGHGDAPRRDARSEARHEPDDIATTALFLAHAAPARR